MQFPDARILIFARAPRPGAVKTRLVPVLGEQGACDFHVQCLRRAVGERCNGNIAPVTLCVDSDIQHPLFRELRQAFALQLRPQRGADLGERMRNAVADALCCSSRVLLTGTDSPQLSPVDLRRALLLLEQGNDVVMQPAFDGGYVMLGLREPHASLFQQIPWGTGRVAGLTRERCRRGGLALAELSPTWDVDRPEDLRYLRGVAGFECWARVPWPAR